MALPVLFLSCSVLLRCSRITLKFVLEAFESINAGSRLLFFFSDSC
jgi:hypothetical protein